MYKLAKSPGAIIHIFTRLCLSQVKEQLPENLIYFVSNPISFICKGHLYSFLDNLSFLEEPIYEDAINLQSLVFADILNWVYPYKGENNPF